MIMTYDPVLVALSVLIAICGAYTCFHLMDRLTRLYGGSWKSTILAAALAIGGGIWSMHFVAMLAMNLPGTVSYNLQQTLLSALIAIGVTAIALYLVTFRMATERLTVASGILLGVGISAMHYVGMGAIRGNYMVSYDAGLVVVSVLVGICASIMALYLALRVHNKLKQIPAAIAMGLGISGMHYTGMLATTFTLSSDATAVASPVIDNATMAVVITIAAFVLLGSTFFLAAPVPDASRREEAETPGKAALDKVLHTLPGHTLPDHTLPGHTLPGHTLPGNEAENRGLEETRIPVQAGKRRAYVYANEIVCVHADSHYTRVCSADEEFFCNLSISEIARKLEPHGFLRVHRSHLVSVRHIKEFNRQKEHGDVIVIVAGNEHQVPVSRGKVELLKVTLAGFEMAFVAG